MSIYSCWRPPASLQARPARGPSRQRCHGVDGKHLVDKVPDRLVGEVCVVAVHAASAAGVAGGAADVQAHLRAVGRGGGSFFYTAQV